MTRAWGSVVALSGGVGGARFLRGLAHVLPPASLTSIVNTGDDFTHWGLSICPDLDTVMYTLAGLSDEARGWGLANETFRTFERMRELGQPDWFMLGDRDLATHLARTAALRAGEPLHAVTARLCAQVGISGAVLPMSDVPCATAIRTQENATLSFQDWFVKYRAPRVSGVRVREDAPPAPGVLDAIDRADAVFIGPSNPYVSIDPILAVQGVRDALAKKPVFAVSPIVGGAAVKGPLAAMIPDLAGEAPTAGAIARHYRGLLRGMIVERGDEATVAGLPVLATATVMQGLEGSARLATECLAFAEAHLGR